MESIETVTVEKIEFLNNNQEIDHHHRPKRRAGNHNLNGKSELHHIKCPKSSYLPKVLKLIQACDHVNNSDMVSVVFADQKLDYIRELISITNKKQMFTTNHMLFFTNAKLSNDNEPGNFLLLPHSDLTNRTISTIFTFVLARGFERLIFDQLYSLGTIEKLLPYIRTSKGFVKTITICYPAKFADADINELLMLDFSPIKTPKHQRCC